MRCLVCDKIFRNAKGKTREIQTCRRCRDKSQKKSSPAKVTD